VRRGTDNRILYSADSSHPPEEQTKPSTHYASSQLFRKLVGFCALGGKKRSLKLFSVPDVFIYELMNKKMKKKR
jgi:hypothetical protein